MNKRQRIQWKRYLNSYSKHGARDLDKVYDAYSSEKYSAWIKIQKRCADENGFCLTVSSAGIQFFSTDYIRKIEGNEYEWVHDSAGRLQRIRFEGDMCYEARSAGIREPW